MNKDAVPPSYTHPSSTNAPPTSSIPANMENFIPSLGSCKEETTLSSSSKRSSRVRISYQVAKQRGRYEYTERRCTNNQTDNKERTPLFLGLNIKNMKLC